MCISTFPKSNLRHNFIRTSDTKNTIFPKYAKYSAPSSVVRINFLRTFSTKRSRPEFTITSRFVTVTISKITRTNYLYVPIPSYRLARALYIIYKSLTRYEVIPEPRTRVFVVTKTQYGLFCTKFAYNYATFIRKTFFVAFDVRVRFTLPSGGVGGILFASLCYSRRFCMSSVSRRLTQRRLADTDRYGRVKRKERRFFERPRYAIVFGENSTTGLTTKPAKIPFRYFECVRQECCPHTGFRTWNYDGYVFYTSSNDIYMGFLLPLQ